MINLKNILSNFKFPLNKLLLDPLFQINDMDFEFKKINYYTVINDKSYNLFYFNEKTAKYYINNFRNLDIYKIPEYFNDKTVFLINSNVFNNYLYKTIISFIINSNSYVLTVDNKNIKCKNIIYILKKFKSKRIKLYNKQAFINKLVLYFSNKVKRKQRRTKFVNWYDTLNFLKKNDNLIRFGDGEFDLMYMNNNHPYQTYSEKVKNLLLDSYEYFLKKERIAINDKIIANYMYLNDRHNYQDMNVISLNIDDKKYYSACLFGVEPYILNTENKDYLFQPTSFFINGKNYPINSSKFYKETLIGKESINRYNNIFNDFFDKKLMDKNVVLITGEKNKRYLENRIFKCAKTLHFFKIRDYDAFCELEKYIKEIKEIIKKDKNTYFVISAGPCGKYLSMIIDEENGKFIDIGNFINYYDYYNNLLNINNLQIIHSRKEFEKYK